jgi:hypothetical protein
MTRWENMAAQDKFEPIKDAIEAGLRNIVKWYRRTDETSIYFVAHGSVACSSFLPSYLLNMVLYLVLNPTIKDRYLRAAWEDQYVEAGMARFRKIVSSCPLA